METKNQQRAMEMLWTAESTIGVIKSTRLRYLGHVDKERESVTRHNFTNDPEGKR